MASISSRNLVDAVLRVEGMSFAQRERLADEVHARQPNLFYSVLALHLYGATLMQIKVVLNLLFVFYEAMKISGSNWPVISEDLQERCLKRISASVRFIEGPVAKTTSAGHRGRRRRPPRAAVARLPLRQVQGERPRRCQNRIGKDAHAGSAEPGRVHRRNSAASDIVQQPAWSNCAMARRRLNRRAITVVWQRHRTSARALSTHIGGNLQIEIAISPPSWLNSTRLGNAFGGANTEAQRTAVRVACKSASTLGLPGIQPILKKMPHSPSPSRLERGNERASTVRRCATLPPLAARETRCAAIGNMALLFKAKRNPSEPH